LKNVGKTTLLKVLRQGASVRNKFVSMLTGKGVRSATEGIDIEEWSPTDGLTLSAWDFGGQEVYYNTHEFFLSQRSVFLLIFNLAENLEAGRLTGWLNSIQSRAPGAPVILVGTNADNKACTKPHINSVQAILGQTIQRWRNALEREKPIVIDNSGVDGCSFHQVSCIKGTGIEVLEKK
jgi:GTPase SAR1 family protein